MRSASSPQTRSIQKKKNPAEADNQKKTMNEIMTQAPGLIPGGKVKVTGTGVVLEEDVTLDELKSALRETVRMESGCKFAIGDLANVIAGMTGSELVDVAHEVQMKPAELARIAKVSLSTPVEKRRDGTVHFDFFVEALALPPERRDSVLDEVAGGDIRSPRVLRKRIQLGRLPTEADMRPKEDGDRGEENLIPHVNKIVSFVSRIDLRSMSPQQLYALHEDLLPVLEVHADVMKMIHISGGQESSDVEADVAEAFGEKGGE